MIEIIDSLKNRDTMERSLRNCLLLAMKNLASGGDDPDWQAIVRFCAEAGVEASPLRTSLNEVSPRK